MKINSWAYQVNSIHLVLEKITQWPWAIKIRTFLGLNMIVMLVGYWLIVQDIFTQLENLKVQEIDLKTDFKNKKSQLFNRLKYRQFVPDSSRIKQGLEAFSLDTLKFVGILSQDNDTWGLIELPDSQIVQVHIGNYVGQNYGYVQAIKNDGIQLEETIKNASGVWKKHRVTLDFNTRK